MAGFGIATPLSQTNFLPDLMQVKVLPEAVAVFPAFGHVEPALTAAFTGEITADVQS